MGDYIFFIYLLLSTLVGWSVTFLSFRSVRYVIIAITSILGASAFLLDSNYRIMIILIESELLLLQIFNLTRAGMFRYQQNTAKRVLNSGLALSALGGLFSVIGVYLQSYSYFNVYTNSIIVFMMGLIGLYMVYKNIDKMHNKYSLSDDDLPTVSVLIPARNEDTQLTDCIESVLSNDYPKLEVIVLDDCSQDNSSEIIKSFAQKGVRFIQGDMPEENWLAKNQAYKVLAENASGDWYLFMGVDVRLSKKTIRKFMTEVMSTEAKMACVMPSFQNTGARAIFYSLRYYWELVLPLFIMRHPPSVSTCWVINDEALKNCGGFDAVSQSVLPERYFAKRLNIVGKYHLYRSTNELLVSTTKNYTDQIETSERLLYPQLRKSIYRLFMMSLLIGLLITQYAFLLKAIIDTETTHLVIIVISLLPSLISFATVSSYQGIQYKIMRALLMPFILVQELILAYISAYRYEFSEVIWKGRNVCYPLLRAIPKLPKI